LDTSRRHSRDTRGEFREVAGRGELKSVTAIALCVAMVGSILVGLSFVSVRMAYHRAYTEIASSCDRVSLIVVDRSKYFCAPVARMEVAQSTAEADTRAVSGRHRGQGPAL
jgi:hypothetical protein